MSQPSENNQIDPFFNTPINSSSEMQMHNMAMNMFFRLSPDLFCIVSREAHFLYLNPAWEQTTGYAIDDLKSRSFIDFIHPLDREYTLQIFQNQFESDDGFKDVTRFLCKDGNYRWFEWRGNANEGGQTSCVVARDITEQKIAQEDLRIKEERYRFLADNALDVVWTMKIDGTITYVSPAVEQLRGITPEEAMNQTIDQILTPDSQAKSIGYIQKLYEDLAAGRPPENYRGEQEYYRKDGSIMWADVFTFPIVGSDISTTTLLGFSRDISKRKEYEAMLLEQANSLQELNNAKDKFFSIIAHDLRSPFNVFVGLLQLLGRKVEKMSLSEIQQHVGMLDNSAKKLSQLLENLLEWSCFQTGTFTSSPTAFSMIEQIKENATLLSEAFHKKEITVNIDIPDDVTVFADMKMVDGTLRNLFSNAIKFTKQKGIISISAHRRPDQLVQVSIKDSGIGMGNSILENLFQIGAKINRPGTDGEPSSGLGLILVKEYVEKNGGTIWVESEEDMGSVFHFTIPVNQK
ncbi:MAG: hypothetical protein CFE25_08145 [Chitinophagaceae bacterium BSSC1]|nr:MAG: hypothetical protein CFE25_08145 [Chitinophagaceae bacterium BSSC1]